MSAARRGAWAGADAIVVGTGPVGLRAALGLVERGAHVRVVSDTLPLAVSQSAIGQAAAGLIEPVAVADDDSALVTELVVESLATYQAEAFLPTTGVDVRRVLYSPADPSRPPSWLPEMPRAVRLDDRTWRYDGLVVTPPTWARHALARLADAGVRPVLQHVTALEDLTPAADLVVNATGPGAWGLGDSEMFGIRGVIVWVSPGPDLAEVRFDERTFVYGIPQRWKCALGGTNNVVTGDPASWNRTARSDEVDRILRGARRLYPEADLCPERVLSVSTDYRPGRTRLRIEAERRGQAVLLHMTGFGGSGWTLAPAAARAGLEIAARLREQATPASKPGAA